MRTKGMSAVFLICVLLAGCAGGENNRYKPAFESDNITIHYWTEIYKKGKRQKDVINFNWELIRNGRLTISSDSKDNDKMMYLRASMEYGQGNAVANEGKIKHSRTTTVQTQVIIPSESKLFINEPITLMSYVRDGGEQINVTSEALELCDETRELPDFILEYDEVILFRIVAEG